MDNQPPESLGPSPPASVNEAERKAAEANLTSLASEFAICQDWGLFAGKKPGIEDIEQEIWKNIQQASDAIDARKFSTANLLLLKGRGLLNNLQCTQHWWYRANNRFGLFPILCTIITATITYFTVFRWFLDWPLSKIIHHPTFLGFAGAVLKSLYWTQYQINRGALRPRWFAYFLVAPFVGVLLGGVAGLIVYVGFNLAKGAGQDVPDWRVVGLFAAFAGFNWEWALEKFRISAEAVSSRFSEKKTSGKSDK